MRNNKRRKTLRIIAIAALALLLALGIGGLWLNANYKRIIQKKLPAMAAKATDSLYQVTAGDVDIDLLGRKVVITDFELVPDPQHLARLKRDFDLPNILLKIHIDQITMDDIAWGEVLRNREIVCGNMSILHPVVRITKLADGTKDSAKEEKPSSIQAIKAAGIVILNPDLGFSDGTDAQSASYAVSGGRIDLSDWKYDLRQPNDSNRLFYASNTSIRLDTFFIRKPDALSRISSGRIAYDQAAGSFSINHLSIVPALSKAAFYRRVGYQKELYDVHFPSILLNGLDWKALLQRRSLVAGEASIDDAVINIYMSRVPPPNLESKNGKFPQQLLMKLKLPVFIPLIRIAEGRFAYTELNQKSMQEGTVAMSSIRGSIQNITNIPAKLRQDNTCIIALKGAFKGSTVEATFRLRIDSKSGAFRIEGGSSAMDGTRLNDITRPLALTEIRSLRLGSLQFRLEGDQSGAHGQMRMPYLDLKAHLLEPQDGKLDRKDVTTFLANRFLIHENNPDPGKELRIVNPDFKRDKTKSFFNLVWKTIFTGALQTVSRKVVKLDKMVNKKQQKQEEKRKSEAREGKK